MSRTAKRSRVVFNDIQPEALLSPDIPVGHQTVAGWWVTRELKAFELLSEPLETLREEEDAVRRRCQRTSVSPLWVNPSPLYKAFGREGEMAFPLDVLATHYPESP